MNRAREYYHKKYGQEPNICLVNPATQYDSLPKSLGMDVFVDRMVLPNHFWLGIKSLTPAD